MNKADLIEVLSGRLGDRKSATTALDAMINEIQNAVTKGDKVSLTGFGVFEKRERGARIARNPRTGESVRVQETSVPVFRPGTGFKDLVAAGRGTRATKASAPAKKTATKAVKKTTAAKKTAPGKKTTAAKAAPAKKSTRAATSPSRRSTASAANRRTTSTANRRTTTAAKRTRSR